MRAEADCLAFKWSSETSAGAGSEGGIVGGEKGGIVNP